MACNKMIEKGGGPLAYQCELDANHDGPCMSVSSPISVRERDRWASGAEARQTLAEFQGPAMTFAENVGEQRHPPPHPAEVARLQREAAARLATAGVPFPPTPAVAEVAEAVPAVVYSDVTEQYGAPPQSPPPVFGQAQEDAIRQATEAARDGAMKTRPGDQPLPIHNDFGAVQDEVIADIEARKAVGLERYGTLLQPFNGRDSYRDAYEEALDLAVYLRQTLTERDAIVGTLLSVRERLLVGEDQDHGSISMIESVISYFAPDINFGRVPGA